jgi:hypothetical protein
VVTAPLAFTLAEDTPAAAADFCRLSNSLYARKVDPAYYRWQFFGPPFPTVLATARAGGTLVGTYGLQLRPLVSGGFFAWAVDIMVDPGWQRRGVFRGLSAFALQAVRGHRPVAVGVMANEKADRAHVDGLRWRRVAAFQTWERPDAPPEPPGDGWSFEPIAPGLGSAGWVQDLDGAGSLVHARRSAQVLEWRFSRNPRYAYEGWCARLGGTAAGYAVVKVFRDPVGGRAYGDLVDVLWSGSAPSAPSAIVRFACGRLAELGAGSAATWLQTNTALDAAGREAGFRPGPQNRYFCATPLEPAADALMDASRWFLTMADAEVY